MLRPGTKAKLSTIATSPEQREVTAISRNTYDLKCKSLAAKKKIEESVSIRKEVQQKEL